jgi:L-lactate utilization protein LutC
MITPFAPTELRAGEDPAERFLNEAALASTTVAHCGPKDVGDEIVSALKYMGATRLALTADLGDARHPLFLTLTNAGFDVARYENIAGDRAAVGSLEATVTGCIAAIAATGSIVTGGPAGRAGALIAPNHICVVEQTRLVSGLAEFLRGPARTEGISSLSLQSGPSRTADIEKTLVLGVHGPCAVHVVLLDGRLSEIR